MNELSEKKCSKCGLVKPVDEFSIDKSQCKICRCLNGRVYREAHKEEIKKYREAHKEEIKKYFEAHREDIREYHKDYHKAHKEEVKKYREEHKEERKDYRKFYYEAHKEERKNYRNNRRKTDPSYVLTESLRKRTHDALKGICKSAHTMELLGCTIEGLWSHLEKQFEYGMNRENYTYHGWHVDHIIPCAAFDLADPDQQKICFHFSNLQPLWANDNLRKSAKLNWVKSNHKM